VSGNSRRDPRGRQSHTSQQSSIDALNAELGRHGVVEKLVHKRITALGELRNNADHGHFDKVSKEDAKDLVGYVRRFCDYLSP
jgi:uncharacterized protein (UPF0332 family)